VTMTSMAGRVLLLRHAWAGDGEEYQGDDRERPLDRRGRRQADALPRHLAAHGVLGTSGGPGMGEQRDAAPVLVSSPLVRCRATLEPLAALLQTTIDLDEGLAEVEPPLRSDDGWPDAAWLGTRAVRAVDQAVARAGGATVVVCSHGELLPAALAAIAAHHDRDVPATIDLTAKALPKGAAWLVDHTGGAAWVSEIPAPDA
jgi:8-oxo-(d)GTP phosphatase